MTDELITELGQIGAVRVISRTSVMHYKGTRKTLTEIGRELNVDAVVEGAVARSGGRVRITAKLIQAATDKQFWDDGCEPDARDILALGGEVARDITNEIRIKLTPQEQASLAISRPVDPEAYEACLKGRYYQHRMTEEALQKAIGYFEHATHIDPNYARAYSGLADSYLESTIWGELKPTEGMPKAKAAITKALELDRTLADAHRALGTVMMAYEWD